MKLLCSFFFMLFILFSQNLDFSDTLKYPLGTTSFKIFNEENIGFTLNESDGEKNLMNRISKKNLVKYFFDKQDKLNGIMFGLTDFHDTLRLKIINRLNQKIGLAKNSKKSLLEENLWTSGKYEIRSQRYTMMDLWLIGLYLKE